MEAIKLLELAAKGMTSAEKYELLKAMQATLSRDQQGSAEQSPTALTLASSLRE